MKPLRNYKLKAVLSDYAYIVGLSDSKIEQIEQELTFNNPQYANVKKYSKWATTKVPQFLTYYEHMEVIKKQILKVPLGYFNAKKLGIENVVDDRVYEPIPYPEFVLELRDTQKEALSAYMEHCNDTSKLRFNIQLPTGKGKTVLGLALAHKLKARTLVVVHKDDLVKGWIKDVEKCFDNKVKVGIIKAQKRFVGEQITVATIQTLNHLKPVELKALYEHFGLVILDECHHVPSNTFSLVNNFKCKYRLGLSATPERNDGLTHVIKLYFGDFCYTYKSSADDEDIIPFKVLKRNVPIYYDPICKDRAGGYSMSLFDREENFDPDYTLMKSEHRYSKLSTLSRPKLSYANVDLAVTCHEDVMNYVIGDILNEFMQSHSCVVFFKQVATLQQYYERLLDMGLSEECIGLYYGGNSKCEEVIQKAENQRKFITLATYSKATEGTNVQQWEVAFFVSSLNNGKDVEQAVGRVRRTKPSGVKLNTALVYDYRYDFVYGLQRHGITRDARYRKLLNNNKRFSRGFNA